MQPSRLVAFLLAMSLPLASLAAEQVPMPQVAELPFPERAAVAAPPAMSAEPQREVAALNQFIGSYPPHIKSAEERASVYKRWSGVLQGAWAIESREPEAEATLALLADVYRQGHNLDVESTGGRAMRTVENCTSAYPNSIRCHFLASYIYLSANLRYAPKGEAALVRLRELFKPQVNAEVERGFIFAYLYQGKNEEAVEQIDYFLTLDPKAEWAKTLRAGVVSGKLQLHSN